MALKQFTINSKIVRKRLKKPKNLEYDNKTIKIPTA